MQDFITFLSHPTGIGLVALAILGIIYLIKELFSYLQANVFPEYYKWHIERQKLVLPFAEKILDRDWKEPAFFRPGLPKFIDFEQGYVMIRPEVDLIISKLRRHRFAHIEGLPSSGKSIIALTIAYKEIKSKHTVIYFNRPAVIPNNFSDNLSSSLRSQLDRKDVLIILDDVHLDVAAASKLFTPIYGKLENVNLLFVSRPLTVEHDDDIEGWQYSFTQYMPKIEISADTALAQLPAFYTRKRFGKPIPPIAKNLFVNECGNDVLLLGRYLSEWDGSSTVNLEEIRNAVFRKVYDDLEHMKRYSPDAVKVLLVLGVFYRFEIEVEEQFFKLLGLDTSYLTKTSEIRIDNGFAMLYHSSLAKLYSNAIRNLEMTDYAAFATIFTPFPLQLFKEYIRSLPRNIPELIIGLKAAPTMLNEILKDASLKDSMRECLEREQSLAMLGWSLVVMQAADAAATWRILENANFYRHAKEIAIKDNGPEVAVFIFNLSKVSEIKLKEWIAGLSTTDIVGILSKVDIKAFVQTLLRVKKTDEIYFTDLITKIDPSLICEKFLEEQDIAKLKIALSVLPDLMCGYVDVRSGSRTDFTGERSTKVSLYVKNKRVSRTIPGRRLGIPFSHSSRTHSLYVKWLWNNRRRDVYIIIDQGAEAALLNIRASLFPAGVSGVKGAFDIGDIVEIRNQKDQAVGAGVVNYSSKDLDQIKGLRSEQISQLQTKLFANRVIDNDLLVTCSALDRL